MKKIIISLFALFAVSMNVFADGMTATLQHGDQTTPYFGYDAFVNAYNAAVDGDVIILSAGTFSDVKEIRKSIKLIGNYAMEDKPSERTTLGVAKIYTDNVTIESLSLGELCIYRDNCTVVRSMIVTLSGSSHNNTLVDQCVIKHEDAMKDANNYTIKNSTICRFSSMNKSSNTVFITNCCIYYFIGYNSYSKRPYAIYKNNFLGIDYLGYNSETYTATAPSEFYNNIFFRIGTQQKVVSIEFGDGCANSGNFYNSDKATDYPLVYPNLDASFGNGQDGTPIGVTGGTGFNPYPNIPRITETTIDSYGNTTGKINVEIKVAVSE